MVLILIERWQFRLKENVRFWHGADSLGDIKDSFERKADLTKSLIPAHSESKPSVASAR